MAFTALQRSRFREVVQRNAEPDCAEHQHQIEKTVLPEAIPDSRSDGAPRRRRRRMSPSLAVRRRTAADVTPRRQPVGNVLHAAAVVALGRVVVLLKVYLDRRER